MVSLIYQKLQVFLQTRLVSHENFDKFEAKFEAQHPKFNTLDSSVTIFGAMVALTLLVNWDVESSQRISNIAAATPNDENTRHEVIYK